MGFRTSITEKIREITIINLICGSDYLLYLCNVYQSKLLIIMRRRITLSIAIISFIFLFTINSCKETDFFILNSDTVKICNQVWTTKNLNVDHYRNGDLIPEVQDDYKWAHATSGAWCYYNNDPENGKIYGKLYNYYAITDPRGLAPEGWHIPSSEEWDEMEKCIGVPIEEANRRNWEQDCKYTFSGLPGGWRLLVDSGEYAKFFDLGIDTYWWKIYKEIKNTHSGVIQWGFDGEQVITLNISTDIDRSGYYVRCIKD
jgi:uncharacterized protein (TIGR02145 family)